MNNYVVVNSCQCDEDLIVIPYTLYNPGSDLIFFKGTEEECNKWLSEKAYK